MKRLFLITSLVVTVIVLFVSFLSNNRLSDSSDFIVNPIGSQVQNEYSDPGMSTHSVNHDSRDDRLRQVIEVRLSDVITRVESFESSSTADISELSTPFYRVRSPGEVQVYITFTDNEALGDQVSRLGGQVELVDRTMGILQAWMPVAAIHELAVNKAVTRIALPSYARSSTPRSERSFEDQRVEGPQATGRGRRVGVISDGASDYEDSPALPEFVRQFGGCEKRTRNYGSFDPGWTCNEGTAMLELVHSRAPDAELAIGAVSTSLEFVTRFRELVEQFGADAIVDDLGFYLEPYFEDGPIVKGIEPYLDQVVHVSAAGNDGETFYAGKYNNFNEPTGDLVAPHNFGTDEEPDETMSFRVEPAGYVTVILQWDEPFGQTSSDYDLYLYQEESDALACARCKSVARQNSTDDPVEYFSYHNTSEGYETVALKVDKFAGDSRNLKIYLLGTVSDLEHATPEGSIFGHPAARGVLAVGVDRPYSSRGDSTIAIPNIEVRPKPDLVGSDGMLVSGTGGFPVLVHAFQQPQFYGTSAAGPQFAATVARMLELSPELSPTEIGNLLKGARQESDRYLHGFRNRTGDSLFLSMFPEEDFDNDGIPNNLDDFPLNAAEVSDIDRDTVADYQDEDIDGDGLLNTRDPLPLDASNGGRLDEREPNNNAREANPVGFEVVGTLQQADVDWFLVESPSGGTLSVRYNLWSQSTEALPEIAVFDESETPLLTFVTDRRDKILRTSVQKGRHFVRIRDTGNSFQELIYKLEISFRPGNDPFIWERESNDTPERATTIELGERRYAQFSDGGDIDTFRINVDKPGRLIVYPQLPFKSQAELTNEEGQFMESSFYDLRARVDKPGDYFVSVSSPGDLFVGRDEYRFEPRLENSSRLGERELEPNNSRETAWQPIELDGNISWHYILRGQTSSLDEGDWAYFDLLVETDLQFELRAWNNLEGTFRATVHNSAGELAQWEFGYDPPVVGFLDSVPPDRYFVKVEPVFMPDRLPTYEIKISCPQLERCGDADGDELPDAVDPTPLVADEDEDDDGIPNLDDRCPGEPGGAQDRDNDGLGDDCDGDNDDDGLPDHWEIANGLSVRHHSDGEDPDGDGTTNLDEYLLGTDPNDPDEGLCQLRRAAGAESSELPYEADVPYFAAADDPMRESVIRIIGSNGERSPGRVEIYGIDDKGLKSGIGAVNVGGQHVFHLTSTALETGESTFIKEGRLCDGTGDWRLVVRSEKPVRVQTFVRAANGFVANSLDSLKSENGRATVDMVNPATNTTRRSLLRVINESDEPGVIRLTGIDDSGTSRGSIEVDLAARASRSLSISDLEAGSDDLKGALGEGVGKWRIQAVSDLRFRIMSFIETDRGELANLSTSLPVEPGKPATLSLDTAVNGTHFVRFINDSMVTNRVTLKGFDGLGYPGLEEVTFELQPLESRQMTTGHLEEGNLEKGLQGRLGEGGGYWSLVLEAEASLRILNIIRSPDGFLTNLSARPPFDNPITQRVDFFNPASNQNQRSKLMIRNKMDHPGWVKLEHSDDRNWTSGFDPRWIHIWENEVLIITSDEIEEGGREDIDLVSGINQGRGKRRFLLESSLELDVRSILETPGGRVNNMSSSVLTEPVVQ